jgi:hypothetical protein
MSDPDDILDDEPPPGPEPTPRPRRSRLRRIGCGVLLVIWFVLVMSPCAVFLIATQGEIRLPLGGAPNQELRLWLIMQPRERGFGLSLASVRDVPGEGIACVQTDVRYLLWTGSGENVVYCVCYARPDGDADWTFIESLEGQCPAP